MAERPFFHVGGTLDDDARSYVERPADAELLAALQNGELCLVLAPRQTGKSSLMVHAATRLRARGEARVGIVDFQHLGSHNRAEHWFADVAYQIERTMGLGMDSYDWWRTHAQQGATQRFMSFIEEVALDGEGRVVLFFDEVDSVLNLPFSDDFFTTLRALYNARSTSAVLRRLSFVLLGVATPSSFIKDRKRTPFNIGTSIELADFELDSTEAFCEVLGDSCADLVKRIFHWTAGQPFLVQDLAAKAYTWAPEKRTPDRLDEEVRSSYLDTDIALDQHLSFIQDYLLDVDHRRAVLETYERVVRGLEVTEDEKSPVQTRLKLSGVVRVEHRRLIPRNRIYSSVFDLDWIRETLRQRISFGYGSEKTLFISYRRDVGGRAFARSLEQALTQRGFDVALDESRVNATKWEEEISAEIPARAHFLLALTPAALVHGADEEDWIRREYDLAVKHGRNIVLVREESVDLTLARDECPEDMAGLFEFPTVSVQHRSFDQDIELLIERHIPAHRAPRPAMAATAVAAQRIASSRLPRAAAILFGRERELGRLDAAWIDPGIHVLTVVAWAGVGKTSLVANWVSGLAARDFDGADFFDWSFYDQGISGRAASADSFIAAALEFFGDPGMAGSAISPWDKGTRLAHLVAKRRALLMLDGLEPLQHPPGPLSGQLKDPAVTALLKGLAARNPGLCVVTTRERVADLASFRDSTAPEIRLPHLATRDGVELLGSLGVHGASQEIERLVEDVGGHALTIDLLGRFLTQVHGGDVRRRDQIDLAKGDEEIQGGHAFKAIAAYETWLGQGGEAGARQLAVLRCLGLFDGPADAGSLAALRREPVIEGLTEPLTGLGEDDWALTVATLADSGLVSADSSSLDANPLIREYFARRLREESPGAWRAAHGRLFDHLSESAEYRPDTLAGLQPLYQAVAHGCLAGRQEEASGEIYLERINRGREFYSTNQLGAFGADLGAVACFFEQPWSRVSPELPGAAQPWLLGQAAFRLRALGRLPEALEPMRAGLQKNVQQQDWRNAAVAASNLSELELTLGDLPAAVRDGEESVEFADRSADAFLEGVARTTLADALHQAGRGGDARKSFREAEARHAERQPEYPLLYSVRGFRYCDLLLAGPESAAWRAVSSAAAAEGVVGGLDAAGRDVLTAACREVEQRAVKALEWAESARSDLLSAALDHLTLGRAWLYKVILELADPSGLEPSAVEKPRSEIELALDGLRRAGHSDELPRVLLTRALLAALTGDADGARRDLDEAEEIAQRGPMPLFQADAHLHRARLFHDLSSLAKARRLIEKHGYGRRYEELADAELAAGHW